MPRKVETSPVSAEVISPIFTLLPNHECNSARLGDDNPILAPPRAGQPRSFARFLFRADLAVIRESSPGAGNTVTRSAPSSAAIARHY
jgi:hypothetical protein